MTPSQTQTFKAGNIAVPEQLRVIPNWVAWRLVQKENGKTTKEPFICGTDLHASSKDPSTWVDFDTAINSCVKIDNTQGIGFVIHHVDGRAGFIGFDIDGCRNPDTGEIAAWAREIINTLDSYAEITPSQTGVRVWAIGQIPAGDRVFNLNMGVGYGEKVKIEVYDRGRFFTVTGQEVGDFPCDIETRDLTGTYQLCHSLRDRYPVNEPKSIESAASKDMIPVSSVQIRSTGTTFTSKLGLLMNGKVISTSPFVVQDDQGNSLEYPSHSEADLALATALAFEYGNNPEKIADEFAKSPLCREKWNRDDYSLRTIAKAIKTALATETLTNTQETPAAGPWV